MGLSDNIVSVKTITSRQLSRKPSLISAIKPGESVHVPDRKGGLVMTRQKSKTLSAEEMISQLEKMSGECPVIDTKKFLEEGE
jgi:hypothetical protein